MTILVACGVAAEARAVAGEQVRAVAGGGDATYLAATLDGLAPRAEAIVSWGLAGALVDDLNVGDWVVGSGVTGVFDYACDAEWAARVVAALGGARTGLVHADGHLADPARKRGLGAMGPVAIDMESHVAARVAAAYRLPFLIIRLISDAVGDALPHAAQVAMGPRGTTDYRRLLASLVRHPAQVPGFARFAVTSLASLRALRAGAACMGPRLGAPDVSAPERGARPA